MVKLLKRGEEIRQFILANLEEHPQDIAALASQKFGVTRQAINKHIKRLVEQKAIIVEGSTKDRHYRLCPLDEVLKVYQLTERLAEDVIWDLDIRPLLVDLPDNVRSIWSYSFTEMMNNAIEHSRGKQVYVAVEKTAAYTSVRISDDGEGIFRKIQRELDLIDERHAVLELAKGKLTTDPDNHSGQGIFFTSRMMDEFAIMSGKTFFSHQIHKPEDWILQTYSLQQGTTVCMQLDNNTSRTSKQIFDKFSSGDDYAFTKTVVPVRLAQYGGESLVSRSQAKRLLSRFDKFRVVILDFSEVDAIGQAFADEVFRVFKKQHPEVEVIPVEANQDVMQMISRAMSHDI